MKEQIREKVIAFYTDYYKNKLGILNYESLLENRLREEEHFIRIFERVKGLIPFFCEPVRKQKILVIGAGTGGELIAFLRMGYEVYGIEPNEKANEIIKLKCKHYEFTDEKISIATAEDMPYQSNFFDMIWSWTVFEHVHDIKRSFEELHRVLKPEGWAFLAMPDTRQFWEGHYKMHLPMFLPRYLVKIILKLRGRPTEFIDTGINKITAHKVRNILQHLNLDSMRIYHPWPDNWKSRRTFGMNLVYWTTVITGIQRDQWWILRKVK